MPRIVAQVTVALAAAAQARPEAGAQSAKGGLEQAHIDALARYLRERTEESSRPWRRCSGRTPAVAARARSG